MPIPCNPATNPCKGIGEAVIGSTFKVGCWNCPIPPIFGPNARMGGAPGEVKLLKKKFQKAGIPIA